MARRGLVTLGLLLICIFIMMLFKRNVKELFDISSTLYASQIINNINSIFFVIDPSERYIYTTSNDNKILKIVIATGSVTTLAGSGTVGSADGIGQLASFHSPAGITIDPSGQSLYVADMDNNKIRKIVIATGQVITLAGSGAAGSTDSQGSAASFNTPYGITIDLSGQSLYVVDYGSNKIRKIDIATRTVTTLAGSGTVGSADGIGSAASFSDPTDITIDLSGQSLYVVDLGSKIRKIVIATGSVTTLDASFDMIIGIALDASGENLYVIENGNNSISKLNLRTLSVSVSTISIDGFIPLILSIKTDKFGKTYAIFLNATISDANGGMTSSLDLYTLSNNPPATSNNPPATACPPDKISINTNNGNECVSNNQAVRYSMKTYNPGAVSRYTGYNNTNLSVRKNDGLCGSNATDQCCSNASSGNYNCIKNNYWIPNYAYDKIIII